MSNATALTINELTPGAWVDDFAGDVLDTGTSAVTIYGTVSAYRGGEIRIKVANGGTAALSAAVLAGDNPPAFRAGVGNNTKSIGVGSAAWFCLDEMGRYLQNDNTLGMTFTPTGTIAGTVTVIAL